MTKTKKPDCVHAVNLALVQAMDYLLSGVQADGDKITWDEWTVVRKYLRDWEDRLHPPPYKPGGRWPWEVKFDEE